MAERISQDIPKQKDIAKSKTNNNISKGTTVAAVSSNFNPKVVSKASSTGRYSSGSPTLANNSRLSTSLTGDSSILLNHNIVDRYDVDWYNNFSRFGFVDPYNTVRHTKEYVFITRPDLNFVDNSTRGHGDIRNISPFFDDALDRYSDVAAQLQYSNSSNSCPFSQLLSNAINGPFELPNISAETIDTGKNIYGTAMSYRGTSQASDKDHQFSLEFKDSKFLEVYMFFKMYDEYERLKWMGQVKPKDIYINNRVLHDQVSIYKFIVAEDGMTLLYWATAIGCMPLSVPRETMTNLEGEIVFSVDWKAKFVYDMDPRILHNFNAISYNYRMNKGNKNLPLFNNTTMTAEGKWASCPCITTRENATTRRDKLNKYYFTWIQ